MEYVWVHNANYNEGGSETKNGLPDWLKERFEAGNNFNKENRKNYIYNEVEVYGNKKYVVDSYVPNEEIVSRKFTQLADVKESTGIGYLAELKSKYPSGAIITDSPFNSKILREQPMRGQQILEIPVQNNPIPKSVIDYANENNIIIRDVERNVYKLMEIVYCMEWALLKKQPHNILSAYEAKEKHCNDDAYVAVIYENHVLMNVIEIDERTLTVRFYNDNQENYLLYGFVKKENKLFLNTAYHYVYQDNKKIEHMCFNFKSSGDMVAEKRNYISGEVVTSEGNVDVSCNWECFPEFGSYENVIRVERGY